MELKDFILGLLVIHRSVLFSDLHCCGPSPTLCEPSHDLCGGLGVGGGELPALGLQTLRIGFKTGFEIEDSFTGAQELLRIKSQAKSSEKCQHFNLNRIQLKCQQT